MNQEFIPYKQSLSLKELGFNERQYAFYYNKVLILPANNTMYTTNSKNNDGIISAPLYQQAFRWFREKYGLQGIPEEITLNNYSYGIKCNREGCITNIVYKGYPLNFNSYEKAELACLIKLIEIIKDEKINNCD